MTNSPRPHVGAGSGCKWKTIPGQIPKQVSAGTGQFRITSQIGGDTAKPRLPFSLQHSEVKRQVTVISAATGDIERLSTTQTFVLTRAEGFTHAV